MRVCRLSWLLCCQVVSLWSMLKPRVPKKQNPENPWARKQNAWDLIPPSQVALCREGQCPVGRCQEALFPGVPYQEEPSLGVPCRAEHCLEARCQEARSPAEPCPAGLSLVELCQVERCLEVSVELKSVK